tara:strand:+ start:28 stop:504 length:477 start_codon:yes stop_codon:yes gene_type:complete
MMNKRFVEYITIKELYVSFKDGLMPIAGQYKSAQNEMNFPPLLFLVKVWCQDELLAKSEIISIEFIYDHELGKYLNSKVKRNYNLDYRNNNHLATFFNYLNTSFGLDEDEMWREIKRTIFIDENDLVDYYREDSHHQVVNLAEIEKTYRDNIIYGYSN